MLVCSVWANPKTLAAAWFWGRAIHTIAPVDDVHVAFFNLVLPSVSKQPRYSLPPIVLLAFPIYLDVGQREPLS